MDTQTAPDFELQPVENMATKPRPKVSPKTLHDYQAAAITSLRKSLIAGSMRPLLMAPTGAGKTTIAAKIISSALGKGKRVIFCVPRISLINQTVESFWAEGISDIGVIQGIHELTNYSHPVQVASIDTLKSRKIPHADLVIIDECHMMRKFYKKWMDEWSNTHFIGLSATPWAKGLGTIYDDLIITETVGGLIDRGYLSDFVVFVPSKADISGCRTVNTAYGLDYHNGDLEKAHDKPHLRADIVKAWETLGQKLPALYFAVNRAHAKHLQNDFNRAGHKAAYIDAYTEIEEREEIGRLFNARKIDVVCNVGTLTTGVDWDVRVLGLARDIKSEMLFQQIIGRGLRLADGKDKLIILDHSNTHETLGTVDTIHHDELCDGTPKETKGGASDDSEKEEKKPKVCPKCKFLKPVGVHKCPQPGCGFEPQRQSDIIVGDGELVEMKRKKKDNKTATHAEKYAFYSELLGYCATKGYKKGWASNKYREKFGVWPNKYNDATPAEPGQNTLNFITHSAIKFAKSKAKK